MKNRTVISDDRDCFIELLHRDSDPGTWIVRRWVKFLLFKKRISSNWFIDGQQALAFANAMKREHDGHWVRGLRSIKENPKDSQREDRKKESTAQEYGPGQQSDDEGRWQDDGGGLPTN